jgi:predicted transposase/invertase (TIGR01784 family)
MSDMLTIEKVFENVGWTAKWEARGKAEGKTEGHDEKAREIARNLKKMGLPMSQIAEGTGLSPEALKSCS